jgi:flagellar biosynthetic protein FliO
MTEDPSTMMTLVKTMGALALVVGFILTLSWVAKKYLRASLLSVQQGGEIKILQSFHFEPKKKLMVVSVNDQKLLLGVSESSISLITHLEKSSSEAQEIGHAQHA